MMLLIEFPSPSDFKSPSSLLVMMTIQLEKKMKLLADSQVGDMVLELELCL